MSDFSLIALIRKVIEETDLASPDDISEKVAEMVPAKQLRAALLEALPNLVQTEFGRQRMSSPARPVRRTANPSAKLRALREYADAWRVRLREHISVGSGRDEWKLLADCNAADFRHAAGYRRALAAGNLVAATEFDSYAAACDEHKVSRFADLPESVQAELLGGTERAA